MKTKLLICLLMVFSFSSVLTFSQKTGKKITITGYVKDGTDSPVANAFILIDGEKSGYLTDRNGYYKIKVSRECLKIGILTQTNGKNEDLINGRNRIDFRFEGSVPIQVTDKTEPGDEVVDMGLKTSRKRDLTSRVDVIDATQPRYASYKSIYDIIKSEVPGVMVSGSSIRIRTATSVNSSNEPLLVVDGVPVTSIEDIQPQMVKSIQVLKGSSAAIYGVRGSNGVIVINLLK